MSYNHLDAFTLRRDGRTSFIGSIAPAYGMNNNDALFVSMVKEPAR